MSLYESVTLDDRAGPGVIVTEGAPTGDVVQSVLYPSASREAATAISPYGAPTPQALIHSFQGLDLAAADRHLAQATPVKTHTLPEVPVFAREVTDKDIGPTTSVRTYVRDSAEALMRRHGRDDWTKYVQPIFGGSEAAKQWDGYCQCKGFQNTGPNFLGRWFFGMGNATTLARLLVNTGVLRRPTRPLPVMSDRDSACACSVLGPDLVTLIVDQLTPDLVSIPVSELPLGLPETLARRNAFIAQSLKGTQNMAAKKRADHEYAERLRRGIVRPMETPELMFASDMRRHKRAHGMNRTQIFDDDVRTNPYRMKHAREMVQQFEHLLTPEDKDELLRSLQ